MKDAKTPEVIGDVPTAKPVVIGSRYELRGEIGSGGASTVHAALDTATDELVAVKVLLPGATSDLTRVAREVGALQHLRLPGVVTLRDAGVHCGASFLVMDLVAGRPFPGVEGALEWDTLAPIAVALLETLGRVHAAGVVHRDLKPSNVLVSENGRVTVLDFGVSWGPALGEAVTQQGAVVGTPEYLAPEQFKGHRGDPRSDLYAVGTMLFHALADRLPHRATDLSELLRLKLTAPPPPLRTVAPDVPRGVARVVDALVATDPEERPATAGAVLAGLRGGAVVASIARPLPWLGDGRLRSIVVAAARGGRPLLVAGPPGSGRTRLLAEASEVLAVEGRDVCWLPASSAPYESLECVVGSVAELDVADHAAAHTEILRRVQARLDEGLVVVVDNESRVDRWSRKLLVDVRGAVLRASSDVEHGDVRLEPLTEKELHPLFAGPERIFHLQSDGARELWRRTGGHPSRVASEVSAWVRAGLANWADGKLAIERNALHRMHGGLPVSGELLMQHGARAARTPEQDRLLCWIALAWPSSTALDVARVADLPGWQVEPVLDELIAQGLVRMLADERLEPLVAPQALETWSADELHDAHRAFADALERGNPARFGHVVATGDDAEIVEEAFHRAAALEQGGHSADALAAIEQGLKAARHAGQHQAETRLVVEMANVALDEGSLPSLQRVLYELGRVSERSGEIARVESLLKEARDADTGDPSRALATLDAMRPFEDWRMEFWRHGQRVRCAVRLSPSRCADVMEDIHRWAEEQPHEDVFPSVAAWRALVTWKSGDPAAAARLSLQAIAGSRTVSARLASRLNAAMAFLEAGELEHAADAAARARDQARECRSPLFEAHAESLIRNIGYRRGEAHESDIEFADCIAPLGDPMLESAVFLNEAAIDWRAGRLDQARAFATRAGDACKRAGSPEWALVARCLEAACAEPVDVTRVSELLRQVEQCVESEASVQALGLLALIDASRAEHLRALARSLSRSLPAQDVDARRDILSLRECLEGLST